MAQKRVLSFKYAIEGILTALKDEPNLKVHTLFGLVAIILGFLLGISLTEWVIVLILIGLVIALELTNTAIEELVDSFTNESHPGAKKAKDVAAGAVLVASITALIIGVLIFLPYILALM